MNMLYNILLSQICTYDPGMCSSVTREPPASTRPLQPRRGISQGDVDDDGDNVTEASAAVAGSVEGSHPRKVTFDDILVELGEFGLEQKINYFLFSLPYILSSMQLMGWVFVGATPSHRCKLPGEPGRIDT